jgi:hypothetical protein
MMTNRAKINRALSIFLSKVLFLNILGFFLYLSFLQLSGRALAQSAKPTMTSGNQGIAPSKKTPTSDPNQKIPAQMEAESPLPPIHRTVIHTEAYKKREGFGPHVNFKITPPEKRGRKGRVLVEVYNYSKVNLAVVNFWVILSNQWGDRIEVQITCDEIPAGWSALKWVKIPGDKPIPEISTVQIKNMKIFNDQGRETKLKYFTDLIKQ